MCASQMAVNAKTGLVIFVVVVMLTYVKPAEQISVGVPLGGTFKFVCFFNKPVNSVKWIQIGRTNVTIATYTRKRNKGAVSINKNWRKRVVISQGKKTGATMNIMTFVYPRDYGIYVCVGSLRQSEFRSREVNVTVSSDTLKLYIIGFAPNIVGKLTLKEGFPTTVEARINDVKGQIAAKFTWKRGGVTIHVGERVTLTGVTRKWTNTTLFCQAITKYGTVQKSIVISVEYGPTLRVEPNSGTNIVMEGDDIAIKGFVDEFPKITRPLQWLTPQGSTIVAPMLRLLNVKRSQAGTYTLSVEGSGDVAAMSVELVVQYAPEAQNITEKSFPNGTLILTCQVKLGIPSKSVITWTQRVDGALVRQVNASVANGRSNLKVDTTNFHENGVYDCTANNDVTPKYKIKAKITVFRTGVMFTNDEEEINAIRGETVRIVAEYVTIGAINTNNVWTKRVGDEDKKVPFSNMTTSRDSKMKAVVFFGTTIVLPSYTSILKIDNVTLENSGKYTCRVFLPYGEEISGTKTLVVKKISSTPVYLKGPRNNETIPLSVPALAGVIVAAVIGAIIITVIVVIILGRMGKRPPCCRKLKREAAMKESTNNVDNRTVAANGGIPKYLETPDYELRRNEFHEQTNTYEVLPLALSTDSNAGETTVYQQGAEYERLEDENADTDTRDGYYNKPNEYLDLLPDNETQDVVANDPSAPPEDDANGAYAVGEPTQEPPEFPVIIPVCVTPMKSSMFDNPYFILEK